MMRVLVLRGGPDNEHEVSLKSGAAVIDALEKSGYQVHDAVIDTLSSNQLHQLPGDVVFPVLHGPWGEGGPLQVLLEQGERPFVGASSKAAALCMDKLQAKALARANGIATPNWARVHDTTMPSLPPPLVIKPIEEGSSVGLHLCDTIEAACTAAATLLSTGCAVMAEQQIIGRELTVGVLHGQTLPIVEITPAGTSYDYEAKYDRDDTQYTVGPSLRGSVESTLSASALRMATLCEVTDLSRVDFMLDANNTPWLLEINTMPGFTGHSLLPMAAAKAGIAMPAMCDGLVQRACAKRT
jgi:D-alanine-D-alanine ligase